ncbi:hypothetical protein BDV18DRAFT_164924 [Aspergillus unguis]
MAYITENTQWMSDPISQETKDLIARFYQLADSKQSDAGHRLATEVFSEDALLSTPHGRFNGFTEISKSRDNAWTTVTARKHTVSQVFAGRGDTDELVLFGAVQMTMDKGGSVDSSFIAHAKLAPGPRFSSLEVYPASRG